MKWLMKVRSLNVFSMQEASSKRGRRGCMDCNIPTTIWIRWILFYEAHMICTMMSPVLEPSGRQPPAIIHCHGKSNRRQRPRLQPKPAAADSGAMMIELVVNKQSLKQINGLSYQFLPRKIFMSRKRNQSLSTSSSSVGGMELILDSSLHI